MFMYVLYSLLVCLLTAKAYPQGIFFKPDGTVGASFGGYHASAGLGGLLSGGPQGGLHAQAGTPQGHFASAGLAGNVQGPGGPQGIKYAGAVKPGPYGTTYVAQPVAQQPQPVYVQPAQQPVYVQSAPQPAYVQPQPVVTSQKGGGFNDIFNIPISALQAVNQYLNNRPKAVAVVPVGPAYITGRSVSESKSESQAKSSSSSTSSSSSASSSSSSAGHTQTAQAEEPAHAVQGVLVSKSYPTKYDDIFNIPISVLRSVNNLLNG